MNIYDTDEEEINSGQINYTVNEVVEGKDTNPIQMENPIKEGNMNTKSTEPTSIEDKIDENNEESIEDKGEKIEPSKWDLNKDGIVDYRDAITGIRKPFTNLKNSLDRDSDGEATLTDLAGYGRDMIVGSGEAVRTATNFDEHLKTIMMIGGAIAVFQIYMNSK